MSPASNLPPVAWSRRFDETVSTPGHPGQPGLRIILGMARGIMRIWRHTRQLKRQGRGTIMDPFTTLDPGPSMGVPLGGLGGGTITRGWQGGFVRWQMQPGMVHYGLVPADQFSAFVRRGDGTRRAQVLYSGQPSGALKGWQWNMPAERGTYHALFPRAWTVYEEPVPGIRLTCRQLSPVIPHNYRESSYPVSTFTWTVENTGPDEAAVGLMFSFQNGIGTENDRAGGHSNALFSLDAPGGPAVGVELRHVHRQHAPGSVLYEDPLSFAIAAHAADGVEVTRAARFPTSDNGSALWADFAEDGRLSYAADTRPSGRGESIGGAVCATVTVPPGATREVTFSLAWDMPLARFGEGRAWNRRYTRFYGREGTSAPRMARDALADAPVWEVQIEDWQAPILADESLPEWYRQALFNEAYYLVDGGTVWTDSEAEVPASLSTRDAADGSESSDIGHFAYLEGHEYRMFNTYDVHFYASFALVQLWPELELSLQRDFARALLAEHTEQRRMLLSGEVAPRKAPGIIPHDLGGPTEDPWYHVNIYQYQDVSRWKDLNPKFVLQVYRDFMLTEDIAFLAEMWDAVQTALVAMQRFDRDGDGLIENDGFPDQTYDTWTAEGPSAYSGGLWLAALQVAGQIAELLDHPRDAHAYRTHFEQGRQAYEAALWNGSYYDYDASRSARHDSIMADQLAGDWYSRAVGLGGIVPEEHACAALQTVYEVNVQGFKDGKMGAVNGMRPDGRVDTTSMQPGEVWPGVTYGVAASMLQLGMTEQGFRTASGAVRQTYDDLGLWFMTPEAWTASGGLRSIGYMRPLAIWAMQWAWERRELIDWPE